MTPLPPGPPPGWHRAAGYDVGDLLGRCASGREAAGRGWTDDLVSAAQVGGSDVVPALTDGAFRHLRP